MNSEVTQQDVTDSANRFWSVGQIGLAAYFAGPIGGCYCLGRNFAAVGRSDYSKRCYWLGIVGILFVISIAIFDEYLPNKAYLFIIPGYIGAIVSSAQHFHKQIFRESFDNGKAKRYSYWWCLLVSGALLTVQLPLIFGYSVALGYFFL